MGFVSKSQLRTFVEQGFSRAQSAVEGLPYKPPGVPTIDAWLGVDKSRPEVEAAYADKDRVEFQFWVEDFNTTVQANWDEMEVIGRSHPFHIYNSTGAKQITIDFHFMADGTHGSTPEESIERDVMSNIRFLESLVYPIVDDEGNHYKPATCILHLGSIYTGLVILSGGANLNYKEPWNPDPLLPFAVDIACTFTEVAEHSHSASSVLKLPPWSTLPDLGIRNPF